MNTIVSLYSENKKEISKFLKSFNNTKIDNDILEWKKEFENPIEIADIIGVFIDNNENFKIRQHGSECAAIAACAEPCAECVA